MTPGPVTGLGIETSCDETSVAVVQNGVTVLSNRIYSQIPEHAPFRGVVPEIASRSHLEKINTVFQEALEEASIDLKDLQYVSVTSRPGLVGSLMIGAMLAKSISLAYGTDLVTVDHLEAHLHAVYLEGKNPQYPFLGLLLSGGNSSIYLVEGPGKMKCLADTSDDALGEAFDKAASVLSLPYPGGPHVEKLAREFKASQGEPSLFPPLLRSRKEEIPRFSYSGIKTAVIRAAKEGQNPDRIAHDFQNTVFELVERILYRMVKETGLRTVVAAGGVMANKTLRDRLDALAKKRRFDLYYPSPILCTDNGAMTAALGYRLWKEGHRAGLDFPISSRREAP